MTHFTVTTEADLNAALTAIDVGGSSAGTNTAHTLTLGTSVLSLTTVVVPIDLPVGSSLTIDGQGGTIDGSGAYRPFFVYAGSVAIENVTIADAVAQGGAGGRGEFSAAAVGWARAVGSSSMRDRCL